MPDCILSYEELTKGGGRRAKIPDLDEQGVWEERNKVPVSVRTEMRGKSEGVGWKPMEERQIRQALKSVLRSWVLATERPFMSSPGSERLSATCLMTSVFNVHPSPEELASI